MTNRDEITSAKTGKPVTLSVCMIVKNEELLMGRCLTSVRVLADEIVLVDTGSTDRTVEIAQEYGCRIFRHPWQGDFSAARNESLRHAQGDWIFVIDADEELPSDQIGEIKAVIARPDAGIISVSVYNTSPETGRRSSFLPSVRLFRRDFGLCYQGIVHNRLALPADVPVVRTGITLLHFGYDLPPERLKEKQNRTRALLEKQLEEHPDDVYANFNLAQLLLSSPEEIDRAVYKLVIDHAGRVINHPDPESTGYTGYRLMAYHQAAIALGVLGRYDEAARYCHAALEIKPDYVDAHLTLANIHLAAGEWDGAKRQFEKYLTLVDQYRPERETGDIILHHLDSRHTAWYGLGTIARHEGDIEAAIEYYGKALDGGNSYLDVRYQQGILYLQRGELSRAAEMFEEDVKVRPQAAETHIALARTLELQGEGEQAVACLKKAANHVPDNASLRLALATALIKSGRLDDGLDNLGKASTVARDDPKVQFAVAGRYFDAGDFGRAASCYRRALNLKADWSQAKINLGNCLFKLGDFDQACAVYEEVLETSSDWELARRNLGLAYARAGKYDKALAALEIYSKQASDDAEIHQVIGDIFSTVGRHEEAIGAYERFLSRRPGAWACLFRLAESYRILGHSEAAAAGYKHVLTLNPDCEPARERLASALS